jgi:hypothetical protein
MSDTEDTFAGLLERRWFAAFKAASSARTECEVLLDEIDAAERAWNEARVRLAELEMLRDRLGEQLAGIDGVDWQAAVGAGVMTAA